MKIPSSITPKDMRDLLGSVSIKDVPEGTKARELAGKTNIVTPGDSYLRGSEIEKTGFALLQTLTHEQGDKVTLVGADGQLTEAGKVFKAWADAKADRHDLFDGVGGSGKGGKILFISLQNLDLGKFWQDHKGEPVACMAGTNSNLAIYEVDPNGAQHYKNPNGADGTLMSLEGKSAFGLKRRGNKSARDAKPQISLLVPQDKDAGIPKQIKLVNNIRDPSYMRIQLATDLMSKAGLPTQMLNYAEVNVNGKHWGTYVAMEPMDGAYFKRHFPKQKGDGDGIVVKANWIPSDLGPATLSYRNKNGDDSGAQYWKNGSPDARTYELDADDPKRGYDHLATFIRALNGVGLKDANGKAIEGEGRFNTPEYKKGMEDVMDVYGFLRWAAVNNEIGGWDNYYQTPSNYYLYIEDKGGKEAPGKPKVHWCPYDMDSSFGLSWPHQKRTWQYKDVMFRSSEAGDIPLIRNLLKNKDFAAYYLDFMEWFNSKHFTTDQIGAKQQELWQTLEKSVYLESDTEQGPTHTNRPFSNDTVHDAAALNHEVWGQGPVAGLKTEGIEHYVRMRHDSVEDQLKELRKTYPKGSSGVNFDVALEPKS